ncbi:hypothetical protein V8G54_021336 [Vigna mungo]|uniref:Disease resistance protein At4g27190-like leucine-rich repeats domain-containing protein n=1 Tax=Vigna mungo TaxID=3915 RepID=A0AAQ3NFD4_VIGMU
MTMLECFAGTFVDRDNFNRYMQETLGNSYGPQTYFIYYKDGNHKGHVELSRYRQPLSQFKCRSMCINECEQLSYVLSRDLQNLSIEDNSQWVCLCAALSSNGPFRLEKIHVLLCTKLKNLFCLSCSLCSNIHSLQSLWLCQLESLTAIFKEDIANLIQASPPINRFSQLKLLYISECHTIKTLLTLSLVSQLQNLEIIDVLDCNLMEQIFAVADHDDSIKITLPELTELYLKGLPQLKTVCKEILVCKSGFELQIYDCPNLYEPRIEYVAL